MGMETVRIGYDLNDSLSKTNLSILKRKVICGVERIRFYRHRIHWFPFQRSEVNGNEVGRFRGKNREASGVKNKRRILLQEK